MKIFRPIWAEIDCDAIAHNFSLIRNIAGADRKIICVVKADAYGHGAVQVSKVLLAAGADMLAVASLEEGMQLRESGINADILVLGYTLPGWAEKVVEGDFIQTLYHLNLANELDKHAAHLGKKARVHIKIDTGMGRIGLAPETAEHFIKEIKRKKNLSLDSLFTHLSSSDVIDSDYSVQQITRFNLLLEKLRAQKIEIPDVHVANSATILRYPEAMYTSVRPGILLYGLYPSPEMKGQGGDFRPAMTLKTNIVEIKTLPPGSRISYSGTFVTTGPTRVATIPVGYADGFSRRFSNRGHVLVQGKRAAVIGTVCMDFTIIDVTNIPGVNIEDEVVLIGKQGGAEIHFDEAASLMDTINYEAVSLIGKRVPRIYRNYSKGNPAEL